MKHKMVIQYEIDLEGDDGELYLHKEKIMHSLDKSHSHFFTKGGPQIFKMPGPENTNIKIKIQKYLAYCEGGPQTTDIDGIDCLKKHFDWMNKIKKALGESKL